MTAVDLVLPELAERDATGAHTLRLRDLLAEMGFQVQIVTERPSDIEAVTPLRRWTSDADLTILQHSIGSLAAGEVIARRLPVVVDYHNVTPFEFLEPWDPSQIDGLRWGRIQLHELAPLAEFAFADSAYNARELVDVGISDVTVAPILFDADSLFGASPIPPSAPDGPMWLFVGRLAPNKAQHDLVAAFAAFRAGQSDARLALVGADATTEYRSALDRLCERLGVADAVTFAGSVSGGELAGWYERADVFVCLSDHEGFCVPLLEAMHHGLPIVGYDSTAVPETMAGAGLVVGEKRPATVAAAVELVLSDAVVRDRLVRRGSERLSDFALDRTKEIFRDVIQARLMVAPR